MTFKIFLLKLLCVSFPEAVAVMILAFSMNGIPLRESKRKIVACGFICGLLFLSVYTFLYPDHIMVEILIQMGILSAILFVAGIKPIYSVLTSVMIFLVVNGIQSAIILIMQVGFPRNEGVLSEIPFLMLLVSIEAAVILLIAYAVKRSGLRLFSWNSDRGSEARIGWYLAFQSVFGVIIILFIYMGYRVSVDAFKDVVVYNIILICAVLIVVLFVVISIFEFRRSLGEMRKRIEIERQLAEREKMLLASQKKALVGYMASGIAHDFNNILTVVAAYGALIPRSGEDELANISKEILTVVERGKNLTSRLLSMNKTCVAAGGPVSVNDTINNLRPMISLIVSSKHQCEILLDDASPVVVAETGEIEQVVLNLVVNARDALSDKGSVTIRTGIVRERNSDYAVITVSDSGKGISDSVKERIFEPMFTTKETGTGLGLFIVSSIVSKYGGRIGVEDGAERGTVFRILLPSVA